MTSPFFPTCVPVLGDGARETVGGDFALGLSQAMWGGGVLAPLSNDSAWRGLAPQVLASPGEGSDKPVAGFVRRAVSPIPGPG
eukprot:6905008-Pyramimonas_sp.AAC.1